MASPLSSASDYSASTHHQSFTSPPRTPPRVARQTRMGTPTRASARLSVKKTRYPSFPPMENLPVLFAPKVADRAGPRRFNNAGGVFHCLELLVMILSFCDWHTIQNVSRTNRYARGAAQAAAEDTFRLFVQPFVLEHQFKDFVAMLERTGAGVGGSVVRRMLATNSRMMQSAIEDRDHRFLTSNDLNIIAPRNARAEVVEWFTNQGYERWGQIKTPKAYESSVRSHWNATRPYQSGVQAAKITVTESVGNILQVILASPLTCQTNVITSTRVYAVYPTLITSRDALRTDVTLAISPRRPKSSYLLKTSNIKWTGPCGVHCPSLPRKTVGDKGIASFHWSRHRCFSGDSRDAAETPSASVSSPQSLGSSKSCPHEHESPLRYRTMGCNVRFARDTPYNPHSYIPSTTAKMFDEESLPPLE
ncbi:hypothetical protein DFP72DRAFT_1074879 [Ephemerocybe angulata]|uniref:Uncharacterized protein n=1 Tax=Ephemerocybe angulata TaxID=980116 RepID=A0A8H6HL61_9AGAR|nr:hypothetical protein DFP72DRAFT_1074879 [Tulosesus angulatus]